MLKRGERSFYNQFTHLECSAVDFINDLEGGAVRAQAIVQAGAKRWHGCLPAPDQPSALLCSKLQLCSMLQLLQPCTDYCLPAPDKSSALFYSAPDLCFIQKTRRTLHQLLPACTRSTLCSAPDLCFILQLLQPCANWCLHAPDLHSSLLQFEEHRCKVGSSKLSTRLDFLK